ncbi:Leucine-rich repeat-containing protein 2 [Merluccius polli]|uniref:Leucine-rich repeat-containing protein 2 n=1 Tax=Merluccius polli TaxID=89951 RepID=A0AA47NVG3_MERPO|nr:Leucine-rich repeat-containing protein 2 [Merluccius polli]
MALLTLRAKGQGLKPPLNPICARAWTQTYQPLTPQPGNTSGETTITVGILALFDFLICSVPLWFSSATIFFSQKFFMGDCVRTAPRPADASVETMLQSNSVDSDSFQITVMFLCCGAMYDDIIEVTLYCQQDRHELVRMRWERIGVPVYDLGSIRSLWEVRARKHRQRQRKEKERVEKSALAKINQEWQYRVHCKNLQSREVDVLQHYLDRAVLLDADTDPELSGAECEQDRLIFRLDGDQWKEFPSELQWMSYLKEWHVRSTRISRLPDFLFLFSQLTNLQLPKNALIELPPEIGKLPMLKELNANYNRLTKVPPELKSCENLERLELTGNFLAQLPFELSRLKKLVHLDLAENKFPTVPICVLRMSSLQALDLSHNLLTDLPEDTDRLEQLHSLFLHKNNLSYLPHCLTNISTLSLIVVSGDELNCIPTRLCSNPDIKFIRLYNSPESEARKKREEEKRKKEKRRQRVEETRRDGAEKEFLHAYMESLKDRETMPYSTTKVSISCML